MGHAKIPFFVTTISRIAVSLTTSQNVTLQNRSACRWGDVADGIGGANCRHSYAAYFPGMKRAYRPNPRHPSGVSNEKAYELTQRQRALERRIREAKRELRGAQMLYEADPKPESLAGVADAKKRLQKRQAAMRKLVAENPKVLQRSPRREWAGDMPKGKGSQAKPTKSIKVDIDEFTPCLRKVSTDEIVSTRTKKINPSKDNVGAGWEFDWKAERNVYALYAEGDERIQGLISIHVDTENMMVVVDLVESAPHNSRHNMTVAGQEYSGVGAHLFAFAIKESIDLGYNGFVSFTAKTTLVDHYKKVLGATQIGGTQSMFIDERAAKRLYGIYYGNNE